MRVLAQLACAVAVFAAPALAQQNKIPDLPRTEEIVKKTKEVLDGSPDEVVEVAGVAKLTYKRLPLDVHAVALLYGQTLDGAQKPTETLERYVRQFEARIGPVVDERLGDVGELEVLVALSVKGKALAVGKYRVGVALENGRPAALLLRSDADPKAKPFVIKLKARRPEGEPEENGALRLRLVEPPAKDPPPKKPEPRGVDLSVNARSQEAVSRVNIAESAADGADEGDEKK